MNGTKKAGWWATLASFAVVTMLFFLVVPTARPDDYGYGYTPAYPPANYGSFYVYPAPAPVYRYNTYNDADHYYTGPRYDHYGPHGSLHVGPHSTWYGGSHNGLHGQGHYSDHSSGGHGGFRPWRPH